MKKIEVFLKLFQEEVNALIELTAKLKGERDFYKNQLREIIAEMTKAQSTSERRDVTDDHNERLASTDGRLLSPQMTCSMESGSSMTSLLLQRQQHVVPSRLWLASLLYNDLQRSRQLMCRSTSQHALCCSCHSLSGTANSHRRACDDVNTRDSVDTLSTTLSFNPLEGARDVSESQLSDVFRRHAPQPHAAQKDEAKEQSLTACTCRGRGGAAASQLQTLRTCQQYDDVTARCRALHRLSWHSPSLFNVNASSKLKSSNSAETMPLVDLLAAGRRRTSAHCSRDVSGQRQARSSSTLRQRPVSFCTAEPTVFHI